MITFNSILKEVNNTEVNIPSIAVKVKVCGVGRKEKASTLYYDSLRKSNELYQTETETDREAGGLSCQCHPVTQILFWD